MQQGLIIDILTNSPIKMFTNKKNLFVLVIYYKNKENKKARS